MRVRCKVIKIVQNRLQSLFLFNVLLGGICIGGMALSGCQNAPAVLPDVGVDGEEMHSDVKALFSPMPQYDTAHFSGEEELIVRLGLRLFYDPILSVNRQVSCATCHPLDCFGVDGLETPIGYSGMHGTRNTPTVLNASLQYAQFWDARVRTLEEQWIEPLLSHREMGMPDTAVLMERLMADSTYRRQLLSLFGPQPGIADIGLSLGAFERILLTSGRWDRYLRGEEGALTEQEKQGLELFIEWGCVRCHSGTLLGGEKAAGFPGDRRYWKFTGSKTYDEGIYAISGNPADKMMFKVPGLRNIAETAPYFHDGSIHTLVEAVGVMAKANGIRPKPSEVASVVLFLKSLTGELPQYKPLNHTFKSSQDVHHH